MIFISGIEKKIRWVIYFLIMVFFGLSIIYVLILIVTKTQIADSADFTAIGAISNVFTAIIGLPLLTLTLFYLLATRDMVQEMRKQRAIIEEPAVSLKAVPSIDAANIINLVLKNTGGGPAYDVSVKFDPDIPYGRDLTLNQLNMFRKMSVLDKGESVELFLASAVEYFKSDKPKATIATIKYYIKPYHQREIDSEPKIRITEINIEERKDQLQVREKGMNDLVLEIEDLKHGILLIASNIESKNRDEK